MKTHENCECYENLQNLWKFWPRQIFLRDCCENYIGWLVCNWTPENCKNIAISKHFASFYFERSWMAIMWRYIDQWTNGWIDFKAQMLYCTLSFHVEIPFILSSFLLIPLCCELNFRCIENTSNEHVNSFPACNRELEAAFFLNYKIWFSYQTPRKPDSSSSGTKNMGVMVLARVGPDWMPPFYWRQTWSFSSFYKIKFQFIKTMKIIAITMMMIRILCLGLNLISICASVGSKGWSLIFF